MTDEPISTPSEPGEPPDSTAGQPVPGSSMPTIPPKLAALIVVLVVVIGACVWAVARGPDTEVLAEQQRAAAEEKVRASIVESCQDQVLKQLKDPDSAKFADWSVDSVYGGTPPAAFEYDKDSGETYYRGGGTVNARNSFGGYTGPEKWYCYAVATKSGGYRTAATAHAIDGH